MKILIIGGDKRLISLEQILRNNNFETKTSYLNSDDKFLKYITDFDVIFLPIPFLKDNFLNAPFYQDKIPSEKIFSILKNFNGKIIGGFDKKSEDILQNMNLNFKNILKDEKFTLINAIITAEGTIEKLIHESEESLFELKICITGYGRVSKALARRLNPLCKELVVYNNVSINFVHAQIDNINIRDIKYFKDEGKNFNIIINTIPSLIIDKNVLNTLDKHTLIMDLASLPGGVDFEYAKKLKIITNHYLGIPGKVSSKSAANAIFNYFKDELKNE